MGYINALRRAGAEVHAEKFSGDYQGTWLAIVTYEGKLGVASGGFGSCSACDSFSAWRQEYYYGEDEPREPTDEDYAEFARSYLDNVRDPRDVIKTYREYDDWDGEAESVIDWLLSALSEAGWSDDTDPFATEGDAGESFCHKNADTSVVFDENVLRSELVRAFGETSPHVEVYDLVLAKMRDQ